MSAQAPGPERSEPFVGPQAFQATDAWRFFGRDREAAELVDIVTASRIVLLYSPSGAGKSSLINAALIPRFQERFRVLPVISVGAVPAPVPDGAARNRYIESAVRSIENGLPEAERLPASELAGVDLVSYLDRRRAMAEDDLPELLIFDQFEEILSIDPFDLDAKMAFFEQVGDVLRDRQRWAIFSMREEYDARLDPYRRLVPTGLSTRFRLDLLAPDAATEAIWRPTRDLPVKITQEAAAKLVTDLSQVKTELGGETITRQGPYVDPVQLQVVCLRLWQKRSPDAMEITADDIDSMGTNVDAALGAYYDEAVADAAETTGVPERTIRAWIGDHLITRHGIRNRVLREPGESEGLDDRVIERLIGAYLLRTVPGDATWVELAHDRLVPPVRQSNETWLRDNLSPLQRHAEAWDRAGRPADLLLAGDSLKEARSWARENADRATQVETGFLAASEASAGAARARLLWRRSVPIALGLILILGGLAAWGFWQRNQAQDEARAAEVAREREAAARATADARADVSRTQALAAQAPDQHDAGDDERGALLARQAYLFDTPGDGRQDDLVDDSLRHVLSQPQFSVVLDHGEAVVATLFSPDGARLTTVTGPLNVATSTGHRPIIVWRWDTHGAGVERHAFAWTGTAALAAVTIDPRGTRLAAGTSDGAIQVWDLARPDDPAITIQPAGPRIGALAFSADGTRLAAGDADGGLYVWDVAALDAEPERLPASTAGITGLAFDPDGRLLAAGRADGTVDLWDTGGGVVPRPLLGHRGAVGTLAFSPDGSLLATASSDATTRLWDVATGDGIGEPIPSDQVLAFSPDGAHLAVGRPDRTIALVDTRPSAAVTAPPVLSGHRDAVRALAFSRDGTMLASGSGDGTARIWRLGAAPAEPVAVNTAGAGTSMVTGALVVSRETPLRLVVLGRDGVVRWGSEVVDLSGSSSRGSGVTALALSPDGSLLATGSADGTVRLIVKDGASATDLAVPSKSRGRVSALSFSLDGSRLAIGGNDGTVRVWSLASGGDEVILHGPLVVVTALAFGPDGSVASGGADGSIRIWDPAQPDRPRHALTLPGNVGIRSLAFSPDGTTLAVGDDEGTARLAGVTHLDAEPIVLRGPANVPLTALAYTPDGAVLFTAHADGSVRSWIARTDILAGMVCQKVHRNLSEDEWESYVGAQVAYQRTCENLPPGEGAPGAGTPVASPPSLSRPAGAG